MNMVKTKTCKKHADLERVLHQHSYGVSSSLERKAVEKKNNIVCILILQKKKKRKNYISFDYDYQR